MTAKTSSNPPNLRLEWRSPEELSDHPENWKFHPETQVEGLEAVIAEVGWAGALLWNERTGRLLDGHARKKLDPDLFVDGQVPVLVGSWSEAEERLILATLDPLASLAEQNETALQALLGRLEAEEPALRKLLEDLAESLPDLEDLTSSTDESSGSAAPGESGFNYQEQFGVIVVCQDEAEQKATYEKLVAEGYECKVVVV